MCEKLGTLHSRGKQHSLEHTKNVIERVFQRPFDQVFEEFDGKPIGTGAIAQVQSLSTLHFLVLLVSPLGIPSYSKKRLDTALIPRSAPYGKKTQDTCGCLGSRHFT